MPRPRYRFLAGMQALLLSVLSLIFAPSSVFAQPSAQAPKKLKVYISMDMEGIAGVVTADQLGPAGFEYERFRQFMTNEALSAPRKRPEPRKSWSAIRMGMARIS